MACVRHMALSVLLGRRNGPQQRWARAFSGRGRDVTCVSVEPVHFQADFQPAFRISFQTDWQLGETLPRNSSDFAIL